MASLLPLSKRVLLAGEEDLLEQVQASDDQQQQNATANMTIDFSSQLRLSGYEKGPIGSSDYLGLSLQPKFVMMLGQRKLCFITLFREAALL